MAEQQIRFDDGAVYERMMGVWSRFAGEIFLDWLAPPPGLRWVDVGCGNGAFTDLLMQRCAPAEVEGIDPSEAQLAFARSRPGPRRDFSQATRWRCLSRDRFDVATMALVIFFVPEPAKGLAEMARVVRPGGLVAAYAWDMYGGGLPLAPTLGRAARHRHQAREAAERRGLAPRRAAALWTGRGSRRSRHARSCNGPSRISTRFRARAPRWVRCARPGHRRWPPVAGSRLERSSSACARGCRRMPPAASPTAHSPTP